LKFLNLVERKITPGLENVKDQKKECLRSTSKYDKNINLKILETEQVKDVNI